MKKIIILAIFSSQICFASADIEAYTGATAKIMYTNLLVERSLNGVKSGVEEYNSAAIGKPGKPNTQINTLKKVGSEATVSCSHATTYDNKVTTSCEIAPLQN